MIGYLRTRRRYPICFIFLYDSDLSYPRLFLARIWHEELQVKNMGITVSFIFCLLSGFACFWLFWKCVDWFETI